jgi:hypothetical protein
VRCDENDGISEFVRLGDDSRMNWQQEHHESRMERGREHGDRVVGEGASQAASLSACVPAWLWRQTNHSRVPHSVSVRATKESRCDHVKGGSGMRRSFEPTSGSSGFFLPSSSAARCNNNGRLQQPLTMASYTLRIPDGYIGVTVGNNSPGNRQEFRHSAAKYTDYHCIPPRGTQQ